MDAICLVDTSKGPVLDAKSKCRVDILRLALGISLLERRPWHPLNSVRVIQVLESRVGCCLFVLTAGQDERQCECAYVWMPSRHAALFIAFRNLDSLGHELIWWWSFPMLL